MIVSILLLVSSPTCDIILPISSPHRYHSTYPYFNSLLTSLILLLLQFLLLYSTRPGLLLIGLVTLLLLVAIIGALLLYDLFLLVSLPRQYHFFYPSCNHLFHVLIPLLIHFAIVGELLLIAIDLILPWFCLDFRNLNIKSMKYFTYDIKNEVLILNIQWQ